MAKANQYSQKGGRTRALDGWHKIPLKYRTRAKEKWISELEYKKRKKSGSIKW